MENKGFQRNLETAIVFGTFNRKDFAELSLNSLLKALENTNTRVIVVDSSEETNHNMSSLDIDYLWLPGDVSMAMARNIGFSFVRDKYVSDWTLFVEDGSVYQER